MSKTLFSYGGEMSENYELSVCYFDGFSPDVAGGSELSTERVHIVGTDEFVVINNSYSSAITYTFQVGKFNNDCDLEAITPDEYSQINRWLNRKEDHQLKFDCDNYENIYWLGRFNCKPIKINGQIYGLELTFNSKYPYGFEDVIEQTVYGKNFTIYNNSDEIGILLPEIEILCNENGDLSLVNDMDNEVLEIKNCIQDENIKINSKYKTISTDNPSHMIYDDFNWNYPKLCNDYDMKYNNFTSSLDIRFTIKYSPIRKAGLI